MLPRRLRWMAGTCALVSAMTMWGATTDLFTGIRLEAVRSDVDSATAPDYMGELTLHMTRAQLAAWSTMRGARITISVLLSLAAGLAFAASLRVLMPMGLRREGMRVLLVRSLLWTAGIRTIAGAADTGAFKYAAESLKKNQATIPGKEQWLSAVPAPDRKGVEEVLASVIDNMPAVAVAISIAWTLGVAALFVMFWRYFGRDDVKDTLTAADDAPPPSA